MYTASAESTIPRFARSSVRPFHAGMGPDRDGAARATPPRMPLRSRCPGQNRRARRTRTINPATMETRPSTLLYAMVKYSSRWPRPTSSRRFGVMVVGTITYVSVARPAVHAAVGKSIAVLPLFPALDSLPEKNTEAYAGITLFCAGNRPSGVFLMAHAVRRFRNSGERDALLYICPDEIKACLLNIVL